MRRAYIPGVGGKGVLATLVAEVTSPMKKVVLVVCSHRRFECGLPDPPNRSFISEWYANAIIAVWVVTYLT